MNGSIFLTLFFGLFVAIGVGILGYGLHALSMSKKAAQWPTAPGTITASDFIVDSDSDGTSYRAKIAYRYSALGREFDGERIAFGYAGSSSEQFHRDIHSALPKGAQVAVRFNPEKPDEAALSFGINQSIKFFLIFGAVWTMLTVGMIFMTTMSGQGAGALLQNVIVYSRS